MSGNSLLMVIYSVHRKYYFPYAVFLWLEDLWYQEMTIITKRVLNIIFWVMLPKAYCNSCPLPISFRHHWQLTSHYVQVSTRAGSHHANQNYSWHDAIKEKTDQANNAASQSHASTSLLMPSIIIPINPLCSKTFLFHPHQQMHYREAAEAYIMDQGV